MVNIGNFQYTGGFRFESTTLKAYTGDYPQEFVLNPEDIILVMTCQTAGGEILGIPGRIPDDGRTYLHNQRMGKVVITAPEKVDKNFLYWLFLSPKFNYELFVTASGTKILHTSPSRIESFRFFLPPLPEQKAIAQILGSLDDKIELNRQMNQTLEKIAWTIFKSWFKEDSFPDDWQFLPLEDCMAEIIDYRGKTPKKTSFGIPLITAKIVKNGRINEPQEYIAHEDYDSWMRRGFPKCGDVLMTTEAPLGEIAQLDGRKVALAQRLITLRGKPGILDKTYLKFLMQSSFVQEQLHARATGTTVLGIRQSELRKIDLVIPPFSEQQKISQTLRTIEDKIGANEEQYRTLASIRDTLLPKLLSGDICVSEFDYL